MTPEEESNRETVLKAIKALSDRDVDLFFSYHTEDMTSYEPFFPDPIGKDKLYPWLQQWLAAYPDANINTVNAVASGNTVVVENIVSGTFANDLAGVKATGKSYTTREAVFFELEAGKIKRERIYIDLKTIDEQLGIT